MLFRSMLPRDPSISPVFLVSIMRFIGRIFVSKYFVLVINILIAYFIFNLFFAHKTAIQNDQLSYKEILEQFDGMAAILIGWGIAFVEYCFAVPANRLGHGVYSAPELKTLQEVITLTVFAIFSICYLKEAITLNHLVGFFLIFSGAFVVFKGPF